MIKFDFPRDEKGRYAISFKQLQAAGAEIEPVDPTESDSLMLCFGGTKFFLKEFSNSYRACGELLFSKFCQRNNVPCASIDIATDTDKPGENPYIISQNVVPSGCFEVPSTDVLWPARGGFSQNIGDYYFNAKAFAKAHGLELEKNFYNGLMQMTMLDYLTANFDRSSRDSSTNIMLYIKDSGGVKKIGLCPLFDNEYCFSLDTLNFAVGKNPDKVECTEADIHNALRFISINDDTMPALGIVADRESREEFLNGLANEVLVDPRLRALLVNLDTDIPAMAREIKAETAFEIPAAYVTFAQRLLEARRQALLEKVQEVENEDNAVYEEEQGDDD